MAAPPKHVRILTRAARMLSALKDNARHARRAEYKTELAACHREWSALSKAERQQAAKDAAAIPDMTDRAVRDAAAHLEG